MALETRPFWGNIKAFAPPEKNPGYATGQTVLTVDLTLSLELEQNRRGFLVALEKIVLTWIRWLTL